MGRLASQTAAHKLAQIIGLLVVPIVVLLALYFLKSKTEIDVVAQERAGLALAQWALAAPDTLTSKDKLKLARLERAAGLSSAQMLETVRGNQSASKADPLEITTDYLAQVGKTSGVLRDAEFEVQTFADVVFELAPAYELKVRALTRALTTSRNANSSGPEQSAMVLFGAGEIKTVLREIETSLRIAQKPLTTETTSALSQFYAVNQAIEAALVRDATPAAPKVPEQRQLDLVRNTVDDLAASGVKALQGGLLKVMDERLGQRFVAYWRNLLILIIAGFTSAMAGIGLAILMMRSTLLRLDEVEIARKDAVVARTEAENIAVRFTAINADISRLNQDMALKVTELKQAQNELVKKGRMEQLGQLIATIAHEVRNPLGAIRTTAFMVERKIAGKGLGLEGHLQRINNSVNRCDTIISQLLDFSRTKEVNTSAVLLDDWLAKVVREEASRLPENILIECALGLESETVNIDPTRMQRAIVNLLNNASEALLGQQDRNVAVTQLHHHIWVSTKRLGDHVVIRIADNGPGIAAESIQKIREPLFTTKSFGTGLGIPAVEQVVNQHGGRLDISSDIGKGAVFSIYLPMSRRSKDAA